MEDHVQRLDTLAFKLGEVFLSEADPDNWPGAGVAPHEMTKEDRGDRNWQAKNANQMGALLMRVIELKAKMSAPAGSPAPAGTPDTGQDDDVKRYEKQAKELLKKVQAGTGA